MNSRLCITVLLASIYAPAITVAQDVDFIREVRPIFQKHCYSCHGPEKQKSGYRLDIKSIAIKGGDNHSPVIVPGKPLESILIRMVKGVEKELTMPPKGNRLTEIEITTLSKWVQNGAIWPDGIDLARLKDSKSHWAFQPVQKQEPPKVSDPKWNKNPIDKFILDRLEKESIKPSHSADKTSWLRRVCLDLTGLPPSPEQVVIFNKDSSSNARQKMVESLLDSPRYGERWAQHWLDVVRYADTHGFEVNTERPNAWPYRDYVIDAFNKDTPYNRFIQEQIAGDAFGKDAATGSLVTSSVLLPGQIGADEPSKRLARQDALDEIVINLGQTFLGLSIGCARCHDHKFDPISQKEYYSMQAFVAGVEYGDRPINTPEALAAKKQAAITKEKLSAIDGKLARLTPLAYSGAKRPMINPRQNTDRFKPTKAKQLRFTILKTNNLEPCIDELEVFDTNGKNVALAASGTKVHSSGNNTSPNRHELRFIHDGEYGNSRSWMSNETGKGWIVMEFPQEYVIERISWGRDRQGKFSDRLALEYLIETSIDNKTWLKASDASDRIAYDPKVKKIAEFSTAGLSDSESKEAKKLLEEKKQLESSLKDEESSSLAFAGVFRKPDLIKLLYRGDPEQPKEEVIPTFPQILGDFKFPNETPEQDRRKKLADLIASPTNPLTARVMVNRIWQGHFGIGLVETSSDFGNSGTKPSHPELLDWLAGEFVRSGWSIKHMHKLIVLSETYGQSHEIKTEAQAKDADVRLLWRYPSRRIEAECARDSMLAVSGRLNLQTGGKGFDLFDKRGGLTGFNPKETFLENGRRRMIYAHRVRRERDGVFGSLDCPDNGQSTARRRDSTTPLQALGLLNSQFTLDESEAFAQRITKEIANDAQKQIQKAFLLALSREASPSEISDCLPVVRKFGLATLCKVLFNSNEFLFIP